MIRSTARSAAGLAIAAILACVLAASGAVAEPATTPTGWVVFSGLNPSKGVVTLFARREGSKKDIELRAGSGMGVFSKSDFTDATRPPALTGPLHDELGLEYSPSGVGIFGVVGPQALPAGDYAVTRIVLELGGYQGGREYKGISIPFHVSAGHATYLGAYRFLGVWRKGAGPLKLGDFPGYRVIVQDQHERDVPYAKLPQGASIDLATPDVDAWQRREFASRP